MKKAAIACLIPVLITAMLLAGCGGGSGGSGGAKDTLTGSTEDILNSVVDGANKLLPEDSQLAAAFTDAVTADSAQNALGLSPDDFTKYVSEAYVSTAAIMTFAHQVALMKCKDFSSAAQVKSLVAAGFDSNKWICVWPDKSFVADSGSYVLLVASTSAGADALLESFKTLANNNVGEVNTFFTGAQ